MRYNSLYAPNGFSATAAAVYKKKVNIKINFKALDKPYFLCYSVNKLIETVDAEIKVIMLPQRARGAVSRVKNKSSNGPLRVQSNG